MNKTKLICLLLPFFAASLDAQILTRYQHVPTERYSSASRIERLKKGDCTIISYGLSAENITTTPRDDRHLGVYSLVSGKDCKACFEEEFQKMKFTGEDFMPVATLTVSLDDLTKVPITIHNDIIADGNTKLFRTYFFTDNGTSIPNDDFYLGSDFVIESADPEAIDQPFDLSIIPDEFQDLTAWKELFSKHDYYKLREMQANKNNIIKRLRDGRRLKDITPQIKKTKIKLL